MSYVPILDTQLDPDAPLTSQLAYQWRDNPEAIALGLEGATKIQGEAIARAGNGLPILSVIQSDAFDLTEGVIGVLGVASTGSTVDVLGWRWTIFSFSGAVRLRIAHNNTGGGFTSVLSLYKNGVLVTFYTTTSSVPVDRVIDVTVAPGDVYEWRHRSPGGGSSQISDPIIRASNSYIPQYTYRRAL